MQTKLIPTEMLPSVQVFGKLIKKAQKLNVAVPSIQILGTKMVKQKDESIRSFTEVAFQGNAPKLNGWSFVGKIEADGATAIVKSVPGEEIPEHYRYSNPMNCDHCGIDRKRNATFVVKNGEEFKQVGKSCMADFLGHSSPEQVIAYASSLVEVLDQIGGEISDFESGGSFKSYFDIELVVAATIVSIKKFGFVKSSEQNSTKNDVTEYFLSSNVRNSFHSEISKNLEEAKAVIEKMKAMGSTTKFAHNVSTIAKSAYVSLANIGYVVAGAFSCTKPVATVKPFSDVAIGEAGSKVAIDAIVISATAFQRDAYHYYDNGLSKILMMRTADDQLIKMFSSNMEIEAGDSVIIKGTLDFAEVEKFEKSAYKGQLINKFKPRARITKKEFAEAL
jgi:hypothetical protein